MCPGAVSDCVGQRYCMVVRVTTSPLGVGDSPHTRHESPRRGGAKTRARYIRLEGDVGGAFDVGVGLFDGFAQGLQVAQVFFYAGAIFHNLVVFLQQSLEVVS